MESPAARAANLRVQQVNALLFKDSDGTGAGLLAFRVLVKVDKGASERRSLLRKLNKRGVEQATFDAGHGAYEMIAVSADDGQGSKAVFTQAEQDGALHVLAFVAVQTSMSRPRSNGSNRASSQTGLVLK